MMMLSTSSSDRQRLWLGRKTAAFGLFICSTALAIIPLLTCSMLPAVDAQTSSAVLEPPLMTNNGTLGYIYKDAPLQDNMLATCLSRTGSQIKEAGVWTIA